METKTILIVDDEDSILFVLRNSLLKIGHEYRILTALDGKSALKYFEKYQIDLVITDYRLGGMNGLELIETISNVQPSTRMILITGYGTAEIEAEASRHKVFAYLKKPLDLNVLRQIVKHAFGDSSPSQPGNSTGETQLYLTQLIEQLQREISASFVLFANCEEKVYLTAGESRSFSKDQFTSFLSTSMAIIDKAGELLDDNDTSESWIFRKGHHQNLFASRVDSKHLLVVLTDAASQESNKYGPPDSMIATTIDLRNILADSSNASQKKLFDQGFNKAVQSELDKLFVDTLDINVPGANPENKQPTATFSMTYDEALSLGLILPSDELNNPDNQ
jgi:YesN/AraC family two-component response regulator